MKWAVIGASSFSGTAFIRYLEERGEHATPISMRAPPKYIATVVRESRASVVVNFAALNMVGESWAYAGDYYRVNVVKTAEVVEELRALPLLRYVNVSTPEVYGVAKGRLDEATPFDPSTPYAASRAAHDFHLSAMYRTFGLPVVTVRTVNVYGPGQQLYRIIPRTVMSVLLKRRLPLQGGGRSERAFIHIRDHADGIYRAARQGTSGMTYHTAPSEPPRTIRNVVENICALMGARFEDVVDEVPDRPGKDPVYFLNDTKARGELGWTDSVPFDEGLKETIGWYVDNFEVLKDRALTYTHKG